MTDRPERGGGGRSAHAATSWLFSLQRFGIEPGLERVGRLLEALGRPHDRFAAVLVAGTNGKGATTGALAAMLSAGGARTGRFISPHLSAPGERIAIDGRELDDEAFERLTAEVRPWAERLGATFFETVTAMACLAFARAGCRTAVVEAGMGGRLDATNALSPQASIVTNVAMDHAAVLGGTLEAIALDKSGILRAGRPAWTAATGSARALIAAEAERLGARLQRVGTTAEAGDVDVVVATTSAGWEGIEVDVTHPHGTLRLHSPLLGRHQGANLALAALAARASGVPDAAIRSATSTFLWPGRLEPVDAAAAGFDGVRFLLDGAHNPAAAVALAAALVDLDVRPHLVVGLSEDKDAATVLAALAPAVASMRLTRARTSPRAALPERLADAARAAGAPVAGAYEQPTEAVGAAATEAARDGSAVLVAGSLYLVGEIRPWLSGRPPPRRERWQ